MQVSVPSGQNHLQASVSNFKVKEGPHDESDEDKEDAGKYKDSSKPSGIM